MSPSIVLYGPIPKSSLMRNLCVEDEGGTDLVGSLVELLGIKGGSEAKGDTRAEENVVGDSGDTTVVDLDLFHVLAKLNLSSKFVVITLANETGSNRYLLATSRPTWFPLLESQVALAPASTWELTLW